MHRRAPMLRIGTYTSAPTRDYFFPSSTNAPFDSRKQTGSGRGQAVQEKTLCRVSVFSDFVSDTASLVIWTNLYGIFLRGVFGSFSTISEAEISNRPLWGRKQSIALIAASGGGRNQLKVVRDFITFLRTEIAWMLCSIVRLAFICPAAEYPYPRRSITPIYGELNLWPTALVQE